MGAVPSLWSARLRCCLLPVPLRHPHCRRTQGPADRGSVRLSVCPSVTHAPSCHTAMGSSSPLTHGPAACPRPLPRINTRARPHSTHPLLSQQTPRFLGRRLLQTGPRSPPPCQRGRHLCSPCTHTGSSPAGAHSALPCPWPPSPSPPVTAHRLGAGLLQQA